MDLFKTHAKNKRLSDSNVAALIGARTQLDHLFQTKFSDKKNAWRRVQVAAELGQFNTEQLKTKWNNLVKTYKDLLNPPTGRGTENARTAESWVHFESMHEYASNQHSINPPLLLSSIPGCSKAEPKHSFRGKFEQHPEDEEEYLDEEYLDSEYLESDQPNSSQGFSVSIASPSSSTSLTVTSSFPTPTSLTNLNVRPLSTGSIAGSSSTVSNTLNLEQRSSEPANGRCRRTRFNATEKLVTFLERDARRQKKESNYFFKVVSAICTAKNIDIPEFDASSTDSDSQE